MKYLLTLALVFSLAAVTACSDTKDGRRPGNLDGVGADGSSATGEDVTSRELNELTPGSQSELAASVGDRVFFGFNSSRLTPEGMRTLERQSEWLQANSGVSVTIEGHCDERGTREYNLALGERRAVAVKEYLVSLGVSASRVNIISYGKEHPEYLGHNEAAWSKNRRSVTVVN